MNKLLKAAAWVKAPKMMFAAKNPKKAAFLKAADWATDRIMPNRKKRTMGGTMAKGLGAAAVTLPVGLWLGRKYLGRNQGQEEMQ